MAVNEQRAEEDRRKGTERRESNTLNYELLNLASPDKRSEPDRRSGKAENIK
ncbi:MAG: hypothetical protein H8D23_13635 [Candidatus Brocadiales bacterium]|nr:hypothetical protein [Candidatus Brocadiales bacterium]